jgi:hypothetical protein
MCRDDIADSRRESASPGPLDLPGAGAMPAADAWQVFQLKAA